MIELGLQRISRLLAPSPLPWRAIHVAGTNGKGSICAYVSGMLDAYNRSSWRISNNEAVLKHARFTSPHLVDRWDCITVNEETVPAPVFIQAERQVLERDRTEGIHASEFELLTTTAFEIFTKQKVDVAVVEVGLGGRLDATNIIGQEDGITLPRGHYLDSIRPPPLVTAISSIGLDHQSFLGNTVEEIAAQKAGIIKPQVPVVYDSSNPREVTDVLLSVAKRMESPVVHLPQLAPEGSRATRETDNALDSILQRLDMEGSGIVESRHTRYNTSVAFRSTWTALQRLNRLPSTYSAIFEQNSLADLAREMLDVPNHTVFPGRLQNLSIEKLTGRKEDVLLDGAHNAQSARVLANRVEGMRRHLEDVATTREKGRPGVTWVVAVSNSKKAEEILSPLLKDGDGVFAVSFAPVDGMPWVQPVPSDEIARTARDMFPDSQRLHVESVGKDVLSALRAASTRAKKGPLVVAGSLYLVGDVLRLLRDGAE